MCSHICRPIVRNLWPCGCLQMWEDDEIYFLQWGKYNLGLTVIFAVGDNCSIVLVSSDIFKKKKKKKLHVLHLTLIYLNRSVQQSLYLGWANFFQPATVSLTVSRLKLREDTLLWPYRKGPRSLIQLQIELFSEQTKSQWLYRRLLSASFSNWRAVAKFDFIFRHAAVLETVRTVSNGERAQQSADNRRSRDISPARTRILWCHNPSQSCIIVLKV